MRILFLIGVLAVLGAMPADAANAEGDSPLSPLLEIVELPRTLLAIDSESGGETPVRLELGETVYWKQSRGRVGAAITDRRMLMVATRSGAWQDVRFQSGERIPKAAELGDRIVLITTNERAIGFDSGNRNAVVASLGPQESWGQTAVSANVAVVLTDRRALAIAAGAGGFFEIKLRVSEVVEYVSAFANHATVSTPARLLIFRATTGSWAERRLRVN